MIFYSLSNAAYRVSLSGPGAELERRALKSPPPYQVVENLEAQQGAGKKTDPTQIVRWCFS